MPKFQKPFFSGQPLLLSTTVLNDYVAIATHKPYLYCSAPSVPRSLRIVNVSDTSVTISWMSPDPPNGIITRYDLQYKRINVSSYRLVNPQTTELSCKITGLECDTEYECRVRASTIVGNGPYTPNLVFRTKKTQQNFNKIRINRMSVLFVSIDVLTVS